MRGLSNLISNHEKTTPAILNLTDYYISINIATNMIGRAVIIHALEDDLRLGEDSSSLSTGNTGLRVASRVVDYFA